MKISLFAILILTSLHCNGQSDKYLMLKRKNSHKMVRIYPGDNLRMRFKDDKLFFSQQLVDIRGQFLIFDQAIIPISSIGAIDISEHQQRSSIIRQAGEKLPVAGVGYILLDQFNRSVVQGQPFAIDEKVIRTGGILIAIGMIFKLTDKRIFKVNEKNKIIIIDISRLDEKSPEVYRY